MTSPLHHMILSQSTSWYDFTIFINSLDKHNTVFFFFPGALGAVAENCVFLTYCQLNKHSSSGLVILLLEQGGGEEERKLNSVASFIFKLVKHKVQKESLPLFTLITKIIQAFECISSSTCLLCSYDPIMIVLCFFCTNQHSIAL